MQRIRLILTRFVRLDGELRFRLAPPAAVRQAPPGVVVQEVERDRVEILTSQRPDLLDRVAPAGWSCHVAIDGDRVVSYAFIEARSDAPLLFRAYTAPDRRGEGMFRLVSASIAASVFATGARFLESSTRVGHAPSIRAHRAAGFHVARRRLDLVVFGFGLKRAVSAICLPIARIVGTLFRG
jgi:hypothetical protein